ncbi:MAG: hypothetical protein SGJ09_13005 [Phycisphaerae bacterium]|nr:hypothetical protein [Phycisphaerae bacterium]
MRRADGPRGRALVALRRRIQPVASLVARIVFRRDGRWLVAWNVRAALALLSLGTLPHFDGFIAS